MRTFKVVFTYREKGDSQFGKPDGKTQTRERIISAIHASAAIDEIHQVDSLPDGYFLENIAARLISSDISGCT